MNEQDLIQRLERIEAALNTIITQRRIKDHYSTTEVAAALDKAEFTVREWCRLGRVDCETCSSEDKRHGFPLCIRKKMRVTFSHLFRLMA